jgi:hypothetical protein
MYFKLKNVIMENCLKTKLKGSVDNNELVTLGAIRLPLQGNVGKSYVGLGTENHKVSLISGSFYDLKYASSSEPISLPAMLGGTSNEFTFICGSEGPTIEIGDKYSIQNLMIFGFSAEPIKTEDFKFLQNPVYMLPNCTVNTIFTGQWSDILELGSTDSVSSITLENTPNVNGVLKDFAAWMPNCAVMSLKNSAVTGSIENYIQELRNTNRTRTNSITVANTLGSHVTFNGNSIGGTDITNQSITWTENTITYNGITVNA